MLTVIQAAKRAKRDPETIRRWIRAGKLTSWKVGNQHVIDEDDLSDAMRGTFADAPPGTDPAVAAQTRSIVSSLHQARAERAHQVGEAVAPYAMPGERTGDDLWLPQIVGRLVRALDPVLIILFGSRARGDQRSDSDYDLLVVLDSVDDRRAARIEARRLLDDLPISKDVIVAPIAALDDPAKPPSGVLYWALHDGRTIYERP